MLFGRNGKRCLTYRVAPISFNERPRILPCMSVSHDATETESSHNPHAPLNTVLFARYPSTAITFSEAVRWYCKFCVSSLIR